MGGMEVGPGGGLKWGALGDLEGAEDFIPSLLQIPKGCPVSSQSL